MTTRSSMLDVARAQRDPRDRDQKMRPGILPRMINIAWLSITDKDLQPGELVFNQADNSFVYRKGRDTIYRFDNVATRTI